MNEHPIRTAVQHRWLDLIVFFALAYGLTWVFWIPAGLDSTGRIDLPVPGWMLELPGGLGPCSRPSWSRRCAAADAR